MGNSTHSLVVNDLTFYSLDKIGATGMSFLTFPFFLITESVAVVPIYHIFSWSLEKQMHPVSAIFDLDSPPSPHP